MSSANTVDLRNDNGLEKVNVKAVKKEQSVGVPNQSKYHENNVTHHQIVDAHSITTTNSAPICRQFWKSGNYDDRLASKSTLQNGKNYLHIHPKFLHSNATSHKWAFGAIAEILDNAVDEIQNGATFVIVDKTSNPRDGSPALMFQDDGGGMDPEAMRRCLSFGFSDKKSKSAIGQYGNGFKTSSMRLGGDVIVFSCHKGNRKMTRSIGLLSYTFLTQTGHDRIVIPMLDYEFNGSTGTLEFLHQSGKENAKSNLSLLLQWSPYSSEADLLKQFDDIGHHGTKIIIYNLWLNDEDAMELDFDSDPEDICIRGDAKYMETGRSNMALSEKHLANRLRYSLRAYLSVLYLQVPSTFCILLRGRAVEYHNIASDLKFPEFIQYRPQSGGLVEGTVITTIGFLKEAPHVNIHGFNVYHKNRLILPFWHVVSYVDNRGRGVVGVLEANFIEPTHNKQDFEKTSVFQKLENRLKDMTFEYWDYHCGLIGYQAKKKPRAPISSQEISESGPHHGTQPPVAQFSKALQHTAVAVSSDYLIGGPGQSVSNSRRSSHQGLKRKEHDHMEGRKKVKEKPPAPENLLEDQDAIILQDNKMLRALCLECENKEEELNFKVARLRSELKEIQLEFARLLVESRLLDKAK